MKTEKVAMYLSIVTSSMIIVWVGIQLAEYIKKKKREAEKT
jgi:hypothetical protein